MAIEQVVVDQLITELMAVSGAVSREQIAFVAATGKHQTEHLINFPSNPIELIGYSQSLKAGQPPVTPSPN